MFTAAEPLQSAISRQIKALEDELGVALFMRRHRALTLTDDGRRLYDTCTGMLSQLRSTVAQIRAPAARQVLALTTTPGIASLWLIPRLALFTAAHPGIDVRIDATLRRRELVAPFKEKIASPRAYFLVIAPGARAKPAVQAFERWLLRQLRSM